MAFFNTCYLAGLNLFSRIKNFIFSSQGLPIILVYLTLGVLFVLFRMKSIEMDYRLVEVNQEISKKNLQERELSAKTAELLSTSNLRELARKYNLKQPKQDQIILIPQNWGK
jgi:cell division protein FtsL